MQRIVAILERLLQGIFGYNGRGFDGLGGVLAGNPNGGGFSVINCCSMGQLKKINGTDLAGSGYCGMSQTTITNGFYLNNIGGTTGIAQRDGEIMFYKTSDDANAMTSLKVVDALNQYIDAHVNDSRENLETTTSTVGWCYWKIGTNGLPELDFTREAVATASSTES